MVEIRKRKMNFQYLNLKPPIKRQVKNQMHCVPKLDTLAHNENNASEAKGLHLCHFTQKEKSLIPSLLSLYHLHWGTPKLFMLKLTLQVG